MEFSEVREYQPGDDIRTIDWNVTSRTGNLHVKKFIEERELTVLLVLDVSGSADFGTRARFKREIRASTRGLTISAVLALFMVNFLSLTTVASLGSATSLLVYSLVNFGALRLVTEKGIHRFLILLSVIACVAAVLIWILYTLSTSPGSLSIFISFLAIAFVSEGLFQRYTGRQIRAQKDLSA